MTIHFPPVGSLAGRILHIAAYGTDVGASDVGLSGRRDTFLAAIADLASRGFVLSPRGRRFVYVHLPASEAAFDSAKGREWTAAATATAKGAA